MQKHQKLLRLIMVVFIVVLVGALAVQKRDVGYRAERTIRSGQLRKTAFALVSSAENSTTDYQKQYRYIEDIGDGRGYTAGIIGFTSGTGDLRQVVLRYQKLRPNNRLVKYLPALKKVQGSDSHVGLGKAFVKDWQTAATDKKFVQAQNDILNKQYMDPALKAAKKDNLGPLGQYIYYDAIVVHGPGNDADSFGGMRKKAKRLAKSPVHNQGAYLRTFLDVRSKVMQKEAAHHDLSRIDVQLKLIKAKNYELKLPLEWQMYGDTYRLK